MDYDKKFKIYFSNNKKIVRVPQNFGSTNTTTFLRSATIADFAVPVSTNTVVFALAATINAENGIYIFNYLIFFLRLLFFTFI